MFSQRNVFKDIKVETRGVALSKQVSNEKVELVGDGQTTSFLGMIAKQTASQTFVQPSAIRLPIVNQNGKPSWSNKDLIEQNIGVK